MTVENNLPLVSIVTPLYNGELYIEECIQSVLAQTYENWEYIIVNNCSTDHSLELIEAYAEKDSRIRIVNNSVTLPMVDNFNFTMTQFSPDSVYCKVLHADDLLFRDCLLEMVDLSEKNPSVGIVSSYVLEGVRVKCDGLPLSTTVLPGKEVGRLSLLDQSPTAGGLYVFGSPTTLLIRSDLVRSRDPFYNKQYLQLLDQEVCYFLLQQCDFGFVHQVLSYSRLHDESCSSAGAQVNRLILESLTVLLEFGHAFLNDEEFDRRVEERMSHYYKFLAENYWHRKNSTSFWDFHIKGLKQLGIKTNRKKMILAKLKALVKMGLLSTGGQIKNHPANPTPK